MTSSSARGFRRRIAAVAAVATAAALVALAPPGSAAAGGARPVTGPERAAHDVTLITGDRAHVVTTGAHTSVTILRAATHGPAAVVTTMRTGDRSYAVPAVARPYLGRQLDPSLFDVSRPDGGSTVRVDLAYTGSATPSLPGVTVTSATAGHASGYLTPASAKLFGAALARQAVADSAAGQSARSALFGTVTRISAAGSSPVVTPSYPMHTLVIRAVDHRGTQLRDGFGFLMNVDDGRKYGGFFSIDEGQARVSVPAGHYLALASEDRFTDTSVSSWLMVATDYAVTGSGQTLTLDARKATEVPSVTTPDPALTEGLLVDVVGTDAKDSAGIDFGTDATPGHARLFLPPTRPPRHGTLNEQTTLNARDTSVPGGRYRFDGGWSDTGIPSDQRHAAPALARMARIDTTYYADAPSRLGGTSRIVFLPGSFFASSFIFPTQLPLVRAEYAFGPRGTAYADAVLGNVADLDDPAWFDQEPHVLAPGSRTVATWLRNPIVQSVPDPAVGSTVPMSVACRTRSSMTLALEPLDNVPSHVGEVWADPSGQPVAHFRLTRDGRTLLDEDDSLGAVVDVPAGRATYRAVATIDRRLAEPKLSTTTTTDVSFSSSATSGPTAPAGWLCPSTEGTASTLLPVLRALVDLRGTTHGSVPVGSRSFDVAVGYPSGAGTARLTSVTVEVARSGSGAWTALPVVASGSGHYRAAFTAGSAQRGQVMDVRVSATDAAGGSVHQTTTRAFTIGS